MILPPPDLIAIRARIADGIEAMIDLLDMLDGDPDLEADAECGADDLGEPAGAGWGGFAGRLSA